MIVPALSASYWWLLGILIGSWRCLFLLWLVKVITLVFVFQQSFENCSIIIIIILFLLYFNSNSLFSSPSIKNKCKYFTFLTVRKNQLEVSPLFLWKFLVLTTPSSGNFKWPSMRVWIFSGTMLCHFSFYFKWCVNLFPVFNWCSTCIKYNSK